VQLFFGDVVNNQTQLETHNATKIQTNKQSFEHRRPKTVPQSEIYIIITIDKSFYRKQLCPALSDQ